MELDEELATKIIDLAHVIANKRLGIEPDAKRNRYRALMELVSAVAVLENFVEHRTGHERFSTASLTPYDRVPLAVAEVIQAARALAATVVPPPPPMVAVLRDSGDYGPGGVRCGRYNSASTPVRCTKLNMHEGACDFGEAEAARRTLRCDITHALSFGNFRCKLPKGHEGACEGERL